MLMDTYNSCYISTVAPSSTLWKTYENARAGHIHRSSYMEAEFSCFSDVNDVFYFKVPVRWTWRLQSEQSRVDV